MNLNHSSQIMKKAKWESPLQTVHSFHIVDINEILNRPPLVDVEQSTKIVPVNHDIIDLSVLSSEVEDIDSIHPWDNQLLSKQLQHIANIPEIEDLQVVDGNKITTTTTNSSVFRHEDKEDDDVIYVGTESRSKDSDSNSSDSIYVLPMEEYMKLIKTKKPLVNVERFQAITKKLEFYKVNPTLGLSNHQKLEALAHRVDYSCLNMQKSDYNIKPEGHMGFSPAECRKEKRCREVLQMFVGTYTKTVRTLTDKFERLKQNYEQLEQTTPFAYPRLQDTSNYPTRKISKSNVKLPFRCLTIKQLLQRKIQGYNIFIDDSNLRILDNFNKKNFARGKKIFFINSNTVQTCLYLDAFPMFKRSIWAGKVAIIDKETYHKITKTKATTPVEKNVNDENAKRALFLQTVNDFHSTFIHN